uniref:GIY-YIG endonuclease n=1 Tax=Tremella fuciformis TaxID=64657 RepID=A0A2H4QBK6_9TREE|nr:hypothetical protein [Tremella fuciformis]ATX62003.1 hypothetical protein [Tremella fuciformis]
MMKFPFFTSSRSYYDLTKIRALQAEFFTKIVAAIELARSLTKGGKYSAVVSSYPEGTPVQVTEPSKDTDTVAPANMGTLDKANTTLFSRFNGISGVYLLYRINFPLQFYIGSSVNLGARMFDYYKLLINKSEGRTTVERTFNDSGDPSDWGVVFLGFYPPLVRLVMELFFMNTLFPTMNRVHTVSINNLGNSTHLSFSDMAIGLRAQLSSYFSHEAVIGAFTTLSNAIHNAYKAWEITGKSLNNLGMVIFVYSYTTHKLLFVMSSLEACRAHFHTHVNLLRTCMNLKWVFRQEFILSHTPLSAEELRAYQVPDSAIGQGRYEIEAYNRGTNQLVGKYPSIREARKALSSGNRSYLLEAIRTGSVYKNMYFTRKLINTKINIYRYDAITGAELPSYGGTARTFKAAGIGFKRLKRVLDTGIAYKGVIYTTKPR